MLKPVIKDTDRLINVKDIYNLFHNPFFFKRKMLDYEKQFGTSWGTVEEISKHFIKSLNRVSMQEAKRENPGEDIYLVTEETAMKLLESEFKKYIT